MQSYSSSNTAARYPTERVTNLVTLLLITQKKSMNVAIFYRELENKIASNKTKRRCTKIRLADIEWLNVPAKRLNNPKHLCHASLFNVPSKY